MSGVAEMRTRPSRGRALAVTLVGAAALIAGIAVLVPPTRPAANLMQSSPRVESARSRREPEVAMLGPEAAPRAEVVTSSVAEGSLWDDSGRAEASWVVVKASGQAVGASRPPASLRVLDRASGAELEDVEIALSLPGRPKPGSVFPIGSSPRTVTRGAVSPVELGPARRQGPATSVREAYWVRTPRHAWQRVLVDLRAGGCSTVSLDRGRQVRVALPDLPTTEPLEVVLQLVEGPSRGAAGSLQLSRPVRPGGLVRFDSVPAGLFKVSLVTSRRPGSVLAEKEVLVEGERTNVLLRLRHGQGRRDVELNGIVRISDTWLGSNPVLEIRRTGALEAWRRIPMLQDPSMGANRWTWTAGLVPEGQYEQRIVACGVHEILELSSDRTGPFVLDVPDPAELLVDVVGGDPEQSVPSYSLTWRSRGGVVARGAARPVPGVEGRFAVLAPSGPLELTCRTRNSLEALARAEVDARPSLGRVELTLSPVPRTGWKTP